jgi:hypothetical protein
VDFEFGKLGEINSSPLMKNNLTPEMNFESKIPNLQNDSKALKVNQINKVTFNTSKEWGEGGDLG